MKQLILHIGSTKTGSSAIQRFLSENRGALERLGILYPDIGVAGSAHHILAAAIHPSAWRMHQDSFAGKDRTAYFAGLLNEIARAAAESPAPRVVLSSEYWWGRFGEPFFAACQPLFKSFEVQLLCYIRRQDEWLESTYVQSVKSGESRTFREWLLRHLDHGPGFCHYDRILWQWERLIPAECIHVRVYGASGGITDSVADLIQFLGVENRQPLALPAGGSNPSPLPRDTEMIRLVNRSGLSDGKKRVLRRLLLKNSGKKAAHEAFHYLSADETIELLRRYEAGNLAVAKKYLRGNNDPLFGHALPAPGAWEAWRGPTGEECAGRMLELLADLLPEDAPP
jgi:hypothetical protein